MKSDNWVFNKGGVNLDFRRGISKNNWDWDKSIFWLNDSLSSKKPFLLSCVRAKSQESSIFYFGSLVFQNLKAFWRRRLNQRSIHYKRWNIWKINKYERKILREHFKRIDTQQKSPKTILDCAFFAFLRRNFKLWGCD